MTIYEAEKFYQEDRKAYQIETNHEFLSWMASISDEYDNLIKINELQELIYLIASWYEIKYPERVFNNYEEDKDDIKKSKVLTRIMDFKQLLFRLSHDQSYLLKGGYRSRGWVRVTNKDGEDTMEMCICMKPKQNNWKRTCSIKVITVDHITGEIFNPDEFDYKDNLTIEKVLDIFENETDEYDLSDLRSCVQNHKYDLELRERIIKLSALKLLYSKRTIPENGYIRARKLINEFNKELGINISTEEIDLLINKDYSRNKELIK